MGRRKLSTGRKIFIVFNYLFCTLAALLCLFPIIHILVVSISSSEAVNAGKVVLIPIDASLKAYRFVLKDFQFFRSFGIAIERVALGLIVNLFLLVLAAYPLSRTKSRFAARQFYIWYFIVTMLFNAGLVPTYLVVIKTGLVNTIWALILPKAINVFNLIIMQNFMKALPEELNDAAFIDGAGHWRNLFQIVLPLCKPSLAAISLFIIVYHWNEWFDPIVYLNNPKLYPLQTYLRSQIIDLTNLDLSMTPEALIEKAAASSNRGAQIILSLVPVLIIYPFIQRYFTTGIVMGAVKE